MSQHPFYILDVFAETKYSGNQLGVVLDAADIPEEEMQRIARETNFAETTFVLSDDAREGGYDVRIFTPQVELPFAGHPTIGTAWLIRRELLDGSADEVTLNLKAGAIRVSFEADEAGVETSWLHQSAPTFGETFSAEQAAALLGLDVADIDDRFPVESLLMGIEFMFVPLRSMAALKRAAFSAERKAALGMPNLPAGQFLFCPETHSESNDLCARMFAAELGVPEDPATGSANACLGGYLLKHTCLDEGPVNVRVEQGYEIGRPSMLRVRAESDGGGMKIAVGGNVIMIARGELT
ncbi:MAG: PhzF family phenazine biosynthesis protein [Verrucomicrobiia bacterium]|jgi:trans-2,3-dihydro-3-hydroxyanthranilate isomerase